MSKLQEILLSPLAKPFQEDPIFLDGEFFPNSKVSLHYTLSNNALLTARDSSKQSNLKKINIDDMLDQRLGHKRLERNSNTETFLSTPTYAKSTGNMRFSPTSSEKKKSRIQLQPKDMHDSSSSTNRIRKSRSGNDLELERGRHRSLSKSMQTPSPSSPSNRIRKNHSGNDLELERRSNHRSFPKSVHIPSPSSSTNRIPKSRSGNDFELKRRQDRSLSKSVHTASPSSPSSRIRKSHSGNDLELKRRSNHRSLSKSLHAPSPSSSSNRIHKSHSGNDLELQRRSNHRLLSKSMNIPSPSSSNRIRKSRSRNDFELKRGQDQSLSNSMHTPPLPSSRIRKSHSGNDQELDSRRDRSLSKNRRPPSSFRKSRSGNDLELDRRTSPIKKSGSGNDLEASRTRSKDRAISQRMHSNLANYSSNRESRRKPSSLRAIERERSNSNTKKLSSPKNYRRKFSKSLSDPQLLAEDTSNKTRTSEALENKGHSSFSDLGPSSLGLREWNPSNHHQIKRMSSKERLERIQSMRRERLGFAMNGTRPKQERRYIPPIDVLEKRHKELFEALASPEYLNIAEKQPTGTERSQIFREAIKDVRSKLFKLELEKNETICRMKHQHEQEQTKIEESVKKEIANRQDELDLQELVVQQELAALDEENQALKQEMKELDQLMKEVQDENSKLEKEKEKIDEKFFSLSEFMPKLLAKQKRLRAKEEEYANIYRGAITLKSEPVVKNLFRSTAYKCLRRVKAHDEETYEQILVPVLTLMENCEMRLDSSLLDLNEEGNVGAGLAESSTSVGLSSGFGALQPVAESEETGDEREAEDDNNSSNDDTETSEDNSSTDPSSSQEEENGLQFLDEYRLQFLAENKEMLMVVFGFLDSDGNGTISLEELTVGLDLLNRRLPDEKKIHDPKILFQALDRDGSGEIDINEFDSLFDRISTS